MWNLRVQRQTIVVAIFLYCFHHHHHHHLDENREKLFFVCLFLFLFFYVKWNNYFYWNIIKTRASILFVALKINCITLVFVVVLNVFGATVSLIFISKWIESERTIFRRWFFFLFLFLWNWTFWANKRKYKNSKCK